jgi:hypothetical protein
MRRAALKIWTKLNIIQTILRDEGLGELIRRIGKVVYSDVENYVLRRDLTVALKVRPKAKIPINVRPLQPSDVPQIIAERPEGLILGLLRARLPQCYVAVTDRGEVCYLQWRIAAENKNRLRDFRLRHLYAFGDDTVLLEFMYTMKRFRGLKIMAEVMAHVAEQDPRAHFAISYADRNNVAALRGCQGAGFFPYQLIRRKRRFFRLIESVARPNSLEPFWSVQREARSPS